MANGLQTNTDDVRISCHVSVCKSPRIIVQQSRTQITWVCLPATSLTYTDKKYVFININKHNYSNDTYLRNIDSENKKPVQMARQATRAGETAAALTLLPYLQKINKKRYI